jgi:pyruvate formate lyase activating enzyme
MIRKKNSTGEAGVIETRHWHTLENGRVQCDVCPRACRLGEGQRGFCFVRANQNGQIVLTTYGRSSGFCIDPIEKKPLNHFLPGTPVLSFGTAGCNLGCKFCQNWDISTSRQTDTLVDAASPEKIARVAHELGCRSVAFTYNDPTVFLEYAIDTAKACHKVGIKTVAVSAGYIRPEPRRELYAHMDAANIDFKAFTEAFYSKLCMARLEDVMDTLVYLKNETKVWLEVTTLLIPGENDSDDELDRMSDWMAEQLGPDVPWHFSAFHPDYKMREFIRTPAETLLRARAIARGNGMHHVYVGNIHHEEGDSTYCPQCGKRLIGRNWYNITCWELDKAGKCSGCGTSIPGVIEEKPGTWGDKRAPVNMSAFK